MNRRASSTYRVATVTVDAQGISQAGTTAGREHFIFERLQIALASAPDLVVLPEACWCYGLDWRKWTDEAEPRTSPRVRAMAALARRHRCYVALPILERRGRKIFNTLLLLDRRGRIVWHYDKMFLTATERRLGFSAGRRPRPYRADFGRIGAAICFDLNFLELAHAWEREQVDVMLFSSMFRGGPLLATWALITQAYVVSATADEGSQVVDPLGRSLGRTSFYNPVLIRDLPRDYAVFHIDFNSERWPALRSRYGARLHLEIESEVARFILESRDPKLTVARIVQTHKLLPLRRALRLWRRHNARAAACFDPGDAR